METDALPGNFRVNFLRGSLQESLVLNCSDYTRRVVIMQANDNKPPVRVNKRDFVFVAAEVDDQAASPLRGLDL